VSGGAVGEHGAPSPVLGGRYVLVESIGRGAHGDVWRALDRVTGREVAVKRLRVSGLLDPARLRREIATLRRLRVPGVVRLLDEGTGEGEPFVVMDLAAGAPFPGRAIPASWDDLAPAAASLLSTLGRIHALGIVHRDLKPANVLASAEGHVTLLDFGLSRLASMRGDGLTPPDGMVGTPLYISPEQIRGERASPRTDLYTVGIMLYEALSGHVPHGGTSRGQLLFDRLRKPPAPLTGVAPGTPSHVAEVVHTLLAIDPDARPGSAGSALERLGLRQSAAGTSIARVFPAPDSSNSEYIVSAMTLRELFAGRDRLFHEREDAAHALWTRTGGERTRVLRELAAWDSAGVARRTGDHWVVDGEALLEMELAVGPPGAGSPVLLAQAALERGSQLFASGRLRLAAAAFEDGVRCLAGVDDEPAAPVREGLFSAWVEAALADWTPNAMDRVLYELSRCDLSTDAMRYLWSLAHAAVAVTSDAPRARALLSEVPAAPRVELERRRWGLLVVAARSASEAQEEDTLRRAAAWADEREDAETRARVDGFRARLLYRIGQFDEAAALHARSAEGLLHPIDRAAAWTNVASALLEAFRHDEALDVGRRVLAETRNLRHPFLEARAEWVVRAALYRSGRAAGPDLELVDAVAELNVQHFTAHVCLTEAAAAYRAGGHEHSMHSILAGTGRLAERADRAPGRGPRPGSLGGVRRGARAGDVGRGGRAGRSRHRLARSAAGDSDPRPPLGGGGERACRRGAPSVRGRRSAPRCAAERRAERGGGAPAHGAGRRLLTSSRAAPRSSFPRPCRDLG
jgi:tetratricopeptide (TPR) repeat protein